MTFTQASKEFEEIYKYMAESNLLKPSYIAALSAIKSTLKTQAAAETLNKKGTSK